MISRNKYIIAVFLYFLNFIIFDAIPKEAYTHNVWARVIFYLGQYGIIIALGCFLFNLVYDSINKATLFALVFFASGMFIFHLLLINKDLPTYVAWCNSEKAAIIIDTGLIVLSIIVWLFISKKWYDER